MRVLVAVGMTGGHIIPGIAVAEELALLDSGTRVVFAGSARGHAAEIVRRAGYRFVSVKVRGWAGAGLKGKLVFICCMACSLFPAVKTVLRERPDVVVGTGSYATVPFALSAMILGVPLVLLEQNVIPGKATRLLSSFAEEVHVAYGESTSHLSRRTTVKVSGNPTRGSGSAPGREEALADHGLTTASRTVLVFGGSRGAHSLNSAFLDAAPSLATEKNVQFIVQTGEDELESVRTGCRNAGLRALVMPFIHEMERAYACADLVVCRAGATTIAELTSHGLPSILVPYPFSAAGHQEENARVLGQAGASVVLKDADLTGSLLSSTIVELLKDEKRREMMADAAGKLGRREAARVVAESVMRLGREKC